MNKFYYALIITTVILLGAYFISNNPSPEMDEPLSKLTKDQIEQKLTVKDNGFEQIGFLDFEIIPQVQNVTTGTTVRWTNYGEKPQIVKGIGFESQVLKKGESFEHKFENPGQYNYVSDLRDFAVLQGAINVN